MNDIVGKYYEKIYNQTAKRCNKKEEKTNMKIWRKYDSKNIRINSSASLSVLNQPTMWLHTERNTIMLEARL